jgi:dihydroorotase
MEQAFSNWVDMMIMVHGEERIAEMTIQMRENPFIPDESIDALGQQLAETRPDVAVDIMEARIEAKKDEL